MVNDVTPPTAVEGTHVQPNAETNPDQVVETVETLREKLAAAESRAQANSQEAQKYRKEQAKAKADADSAERKRLEEAGNFKTLFEQESEKARAASETLKETQAKFAFSQIKSALVAEAVKHGCVDTTDLVKLTDLSDIKIGDDFSVDTKALELKVQNLVKAKPYLFKSKAPTVNDLPAKADKPAVEADFAREISATKTQAEWNAVMHRHGKL